MNCTEIFEKIDELNDRYIQVWQDVCNIESPTECKSGTDAVGRYFAHIAKERGWEVEICPQELVGDVVCITMNPDAPGQMVTLSGHMDTVHAIGSFGTPAVTMDEEKIYGPGVTDCKGGIVAAVLAMDALSKCGFDRRPIRLLLQSDEENGSDLSKKATIRYICEKAAGSAAFLNLERNLPGKAIIQRKGILKYRFTITGRENHAAGCAIHGANAIVEAAHKITKLDKYRSHLGITICCSVISGGTAINTVPGSCEFYADVRFPTLEDMEKARSRVKKIANTTHVPGCTCELEELNLRLPMPLVQQNQDLLDRMNGIFLANGLPELAAHRVGGGSDAADVTIAGIPCVDSIGVEGKRIHTPYEYAWLRSLAEAAKRIACVAASL